MWNPLRPMRIGASHSAPSGAETWQHDGMTFAWTPDAGGVLTVEGIPGRPLPYRMSCPSPQEARTWTKVLSDVFKAGRLPTEGVFNAAAPIEYGGGGGVLVGMYKGAGATPTTGMQAAARRFFALKKKGAKGTLSHSEARAQGIKSGRSMARALASGHALTEGEIRRGHRFWIRHAKNAKVDPGKTPEQDRGFIAGLAWGGSGAASWFAARYRGLDKRMEKGTVVLLKGRKKIQGPVAFLTNKEDGTVFPVSAKDPKAQKALSSPRHREIVEKIHAGTRDPGKKAKHREYLDALPGGEGAQAFSRLVSAGKASEADRDHYLKQFNAAMSERGATPESVERNMRMYYTPPSGKQASAPSEKATTASDPEFKLPDNLREVSTKDLYSLLAQSNASGAKHNSTIRAEMARRQKEASEALKAEKREQSAAKERSAAEKAHADRAASIAAAPDVGADVRRSGDKTYLEAAPGTYPNGTIVKVNGVPHKVTGSGKEYTPKDLPPTKPGQSYVYRANKDPGGGFTPGQIIKNPSASAAESTPYLRILGTQSVYMRTNDDTGSLPPHMDSGYSHGAIARPATSAEAKPYDDYLKAVSSKQEGVKRLSELRSQFLTQGVRPQSIDMPAGETIRIDASKHSRDDSHFIIGGDHVYYLFPTDRFGAEQSEPNIGNRNGVMLPRTTELISQIRGAAEKASASPKPPPVEALPDAEVIKRGTVARHYLQPLQSGQALGGGESKRPMSKAALARAAGPHGDVKVYFGKHTGKTLAQIAKSDPSYLSWGAANLRDASMRTKMADVYNRVVLKKGSALLTKGSTPRQRSRAIIAKIYGRTADPEKRARHAERLSAYGHELAEAPGGDRYNRHAGKIVFQGIPVAIEHEKGTMRPVAGGGQVRMLYDYGEIHGLGTRGVDGDKIDVYVGPNLDADHAYIVDQMDKSTGRFDEQKVMLGFDSAKAAKRAYCKQYGDATECGTVHPIPMADFKKMVRDRARRGQALTSRPVVLVKGSQTGPNGETGGRWVTMRGRHVYIKNGKMVNPPPGMDSGDTKKASGNGRMTRPSDLKRAAREAETAKTGEPYKHPGTPRPKEGAKWIDRVPHLPAHTYEAHSTISGGKRTWSKERSALHDKIIDHYLSKGEVAPPDTKPVALVTMGGPASGKSSMLRGRDLSAFVHVDSDDVKSHLPEYREAIENKARNAARMAHEESSYLAKRVRDGAIDQRKSLIMDGTGKNAEKYARLIDRMKKAGYHVVVMMPHVDADDAFQRMKGRADRSGRYVPDEIFHKAHAVIPKNFHKIAGLADDAVLFDNTGAAPRPVWSKEGGKVTTHDEAWHAEFTKKHGGPQ